MRRRVRNAFIADAVRTGQRVHFGDLDDQYAGHFLGGVLARDVAQTVREPCIVHG
jgi:hypothetical protein